MRPEDDLQAVLDDAGKGATLCFAPGTYALREGLVPLAGQTLAGSEGTVLTGSRTMSSWTRSGSTWTSDGHLPGPYSADGYNPCQERGSDLCRLSERVFRDDVPLGRVATAEAVGPGTFFTDYGEDRVHVGDDPAGSKLEVSRTRTAITSTAEGITLRGLRIEKFATANQRGAVVVGGDGWTLEGNEIRFNHGAGVYVYGDDATLRSNRVHHNGTIGIAAHEVMGLLVDRNELDHNNTDGSWVNDGENGGYKSTGSTDTVTNNHVHDNNGLGLWFDLGDRGSRIEGNRVVDNASDGIRYEISYDGVIRGNTVVGNGHDRQHGDGRLRYGASISISTSSGVEVSDNVVSGGDNGVGLIAADRDGGEHGDPVLRDVRVHRNRITMDQGATGLEAVRPDEDPFRLEAGNVFSDNSYVLPDVDVPWFRWDGRALTAAQWRTLGHDERGSVREGR